MEADDRKEVFVSVEKPTVKSIVDAMRLIANKEYDGLIHDYVVTIFNRLSLNERKILLQGLLDISLALDDRIHSIERGKAAVVQEAAATVLSDNKDREEESTAVPGSARDLNQKELIKLKSWLVKTGTIFLLGFIGVIIIVTFFTTDDNENPNLLSYIGKLIRIIFDI